MEEKGRTIKGVFYPIFNIGDKVRLRKPEEVMAIGQCFNSRYPTYTAWIQDIGKDKEKWNKIYTVEKVIDYGNEINILLTPPREEPREGEKIRAGSWILIKVKVKEAMEKSIYRTTFDGFQTCDENWEPGNWLF